MVVVVLLASPRVEKLDPYKKDNHLPAACRYTAGHKVSDP
jgi:hypothetical protein